MATEDPRSESFVVQLGRQLRSFYNLKLVQASPMDLMTTIGADVRINGHSRYVVISLLLTAISLDIAIDIFF